MTKQEIIKEISSTIIKRISEQVFEPPDSGDAPKEIKDILAVAYSSCRTKWVEKNPTDKENKANKTRCAKIAWGAVRNAGWKKNAKGIWNKT